MMTGSPDTKKLNKNALYDSMAILALEDMGVCLEVNYDMTQDAGQFWESIPSEEVSKKYPALKYICQGNASESQLFDSFM
jgi:hypothetical protein